MSIFAKEMLKSGAIPGKKYDRAQKKKLLPPVASTKTSIKSDEPLPLDHLLNQMSEVEIMKAQQEIMDRLGPNVVSFVKNRIKPNFIGEKVASKSPLPEKEKKNVVSGNTTTSNLNGEQNNSAQITTDIKKPKADKIANAGISEIKVSTNKPKEVTTANDDDDVYDPTCIEKEARKKGWINMCCVEDDKLQWLTQSLDMKFSDNSKPTSVRFGFNGEIAADETGSTRTGWHHHGEEPGRAGYTLQELFNFVQSNENQQRVFGLKMLSYIVRQAKLGSFHNKLSNKIIPVLIHGDIALVARLSLDAPVEGVIVAAVDLFHAILVNTEDEIALDLSFSWYGGHEQPNMRASDEDFEPNDDDDDEEKMRKEGLKDEEILKKDLVEGLLHMLFLPRVFFIINVLRPQSRLLVNNILDILIRMTRHHNRHKHQTNKCNSTGSNICEYPELMKTLVHEFLPLGQKECTSKLVYGLPYHKVIKLLRVAASSDVKLAKHLYKNYGDNVFQFLHEQASPLLYHESLRFFNVLLKYGLALDKFKTFVKFITSKLTALAELDGTRFDMDDQIGASLLMCTIEAGVCAGSEVKLMETSEESETTNKLEFTDFSWNDITGLLPLVLSIAKNNLNKFLEKYYLQKYTVYCLLTAAVNCLAALFDKLDDQIYSPINKEVLDFVNSVLVPCLESISFERAVRILRENSTIIPGVLTLQTLGESSNSFKTLNSILYDTSHVPMPSPQECVTPSSLQIQNISLVSPASSSADTSSSSSLPPSMGWHPVVQPLSTLPFLVAIARLSLASSKPCGSDQVMLFIKLLNHPEIQLYLSKIAIAQGSSLKVGWFSRYETHFVFFLLTLARKLVEDEESCLNTLLYHKVAINLLGHFHSGDEMMASELVSNIIFNPEFLRDAFTENSGVQRLTALDTKRAPPIDVVGDISENLKEMGNAYSQLFFNGETTQRLRNSLLGQCCNVKSMMIGQCGTTVFSFDWLYEPLKQLYNVGNKSKKQSQLYPLLEPLSKFSKQAMRAIFLFERVRPELLSHIDNQLKFSRLIQGVLAAGNGVMDDETYFYIDQLVQICATKKHHHEIDVPLQKYCQQSFTMELYELFLREYFDFFGGIPAFDVMVLLPLVLFDRDDGHENSLWHTLWLKHPRVLQYLFIHFHQIPFDIGNLLKPQDEENLSLTRCYFHCLEIKWFTHSKTPLPYLIAVHNINHFIYSTSELRCSEDKDQHMKQKETKQWRKCITLHIVNNLQNPLRQHVLFYKHVNLGSKFGFDLYDSLPPHRLKCLTSVAGICLDDIENITKM